MRGLTAVLVLGLILSVAGTPNPSCHAAVGSSHASLRNAAVNIEGASLESGFATFLETDLYVVEGKPSSGCVCKMCSQVILSDEESLQDSLCGTSSTKECRAAAEELSGRSYCALLSTTRAAW